MMWFHDFAFRLFGPRSVIQEVWKAANSRHLAFCNCAAHSYFVYIAVIGRESKEVIIRETWLVFLIRFASLDSELKF